MILTLPIRIETQPGTPIANLIDQAVATAITRTLDAASAARSSSAPDPAPVTPVIVSIRITP